MGFKGLGIKNRSGNIKIFSVKGKVSKNGLGIEEALIETDSGVTLSTLACFVKNQNLKISETIEFEKGTIGGEIKTHPLLLDLVNQIKVLDELNEIKVRTASDIHKNDIILSVIFKIKSR